MPTFILERVVPAGFDPSDNEQVAMHSRWAADAYAATGIVWLGGVAAERTMYSLIVSDTEKRVRRYCTLIGLAPEDYTIRPVIGVLGPFVAMSREDPRFRPPATVLIRRDDD